MLTREKLEKNKNFKRKKEKKRNLSKFVDIYTEFMTGFFVENKRFYGFFIYYTIKLLNWIYFLVKSFVFIYNIWVVFCAQ